MSITHDTATRNAAANAVVARIDGGGSAGKLVIYSGTPPANASVSLSGLSVTAIATLTFAATAFGAAVSGVCTANAISPDTNAVGGTASFFRILTSAGTVIFQGSVATSGADLNLSTISIASGANVSISSGTYTAPP